MGYLLGESIEQSRNAFELILKALTMIPTAHYLIGLVGFLVVFLYNFLEFHFLEDVFTGFRGSPVSLTYNSCSEIYYGVVSKCRILHGRYMTTPWLSSPHIQTTFLNFFGRPPTFTYKRQLFHASDGGTFALDWLRNSDVLGDLADGSNVILKYDKTPIVVVIPGLTSDSSSPYLKHLAFQTAKRGWNVVVCNHRGLGGISVTSDCFYNAGWTEDTRDVIDYLHHEYPNAPLFVVGTSIGANILVKYLGEDGEDVPVAGAVAICSPWDLLIGSRFICRRLVQKFYDRALTIGLQGYAQLHQPRYSRLADWEGIIKSRSIRDFDNYATRLVGKFETVDTYYRHCSSAGLVVNVSVPLLCVSALDDPLCTREAIPWDECRANKNIVLATTRHGGHLAFFEGITGSNLWWVRAVNEFLGVLHSSPYMHTQKKKQNPCTHSALESSIDHGPYVNVANGMVAAMGNELVTPAAAADSSGRQNVDDHSTIGIISDAEEPKADCELKTAQPSNDLAKAKVAKKADLSSIRRWLDQLYRQNRRSTWLLTYIAILSTWPLVGAALHFIYKKKFKKALPATSRK